MAKIYNTNEEIKVTREEMKHLALRYVHQWANLNSVNTEDDFYHDCMMCDLKWIDTMDNGWHDDRQVEFTKQEMEWARKEFEVIDNFLSKRRAKYEKQMKGLDN